MILYGGIPGWFPLGFPCGGPNQIPELSRLQIDVAPSSLVAFDQLSRVSDPKNTALHFYVHDRKFKSILVNPEKYVDKFAKYGALLTPDITLGTEMPTWMRIQKTHLSRSVGAFFEQRQFTVIPSLRWVDLSDLDFVCEGVPRNSVIAVSGFGSFRDAKLKRVFEAGLQEVVARLEPDCIVIYGHVSCELLDSISKSTTLRNFHTATCSHCKADFAENVGLFDTN